eukprot:m.273374 g.273374  ORF g.273374 m.273374 type:complete len:483 (+) comp16118_c0_seq4:367-1815(+)
MCCSRITTPFIEVAVYYSLISSNCPAGRKLGRLLGWIRRVPRGVGTEGSHLTHTTRHMPPPFSRPVQGGVPGSATRAPVSSTPSYGHYGANPSATSAVAAAPPRHGAGATPLADGWVAAVDPSSGHTYYSNVARGLTQWEPPAAAVAAPPPPPAAAAAAPTKSALPQGWVAAIDGDSGLPYYFNAAMGVTQWDRPGHTTVQAPAAAPYASSGHSVQHGHPETPQWTRSNPGTTPTNGRPVHAAAQVPAANSYTTPVQHSRPRAPQWDRRGPGATLAMSSAFNISGHPQTHGRPQNSPHNTSTAPVLQSMPQPHTSLHTREMHRAGSGPNGGQLGRPHPQMPPAFKPSVVEGHDARSGPFHNHGTGIRPPGGVHSRPGGPPGPPRMPLGGAPFRGPPPSRLAGHGPPPEGRPPATRMLARPELPHVRGGQPLLGLAPPGSIRPPPRLPGPLPGGLPPPPQLMGGPMRKMPLVGHTRPGPYSRP